MTDHNAPADNPAASNKPRRNSRLNFITSYLCYLAALGSFIGGGSGGRSVMYGLAVMNLALSFMYFMFGITKLRQARQQQDPSTAPPRMNRRWAIATGVLGVIIPISLVVILPPFFWKPELVVKNVGTNAVTLSFKGQTFVTQPGHAWHIRFDTGHALTVRAGPALDAPSRSVILPERHPKPWTLNPIAERYSAEVNADDPQNILFEYRTGKGDATPRP